MTIEELLQGCKVTHIGADAIKDGDLLVFEIDSEPTFLDFVRMRDYIQNTLSESNIKASFLLWKGIITVTDRSREESEVLRDELSRFLDGNLSAENLT